MAGGTARIADSFVGVDRQKRLAAAYGYHIFNPRLRSGAETYVYIGRARRKIEISLSTAFLESAGDQNIMKTQVEFRSSKFPPYEGEEEQTNPGLWGKRLAEYLAQKLADKGVQTEEIIAEDWGWYIPVRNEGFPLALCCGHQDGDDDEFLCFTEPSTATVKKLFRKIDATPQLTRLTEALEQILSSDPDIRHVIWTEPR